MAHRINMLSSFDIQRSETATLLSYLELIVHELRERMVNVRNVEGHVGLSSSTPDQVPEVAVERASPEVVVSPLSVRGRSCTYGCNVCSINFCNNHGEHSRHICSECDRVSNRSAPY